MADYPEHELHIGTRLKGSENSAVELAAARRTVALAAHGPHDRARLLDMLGLVPAGAVLTVNVP